MRVGVIGLGYLGVTHAVAMASLGHEVVGIETSPIAWRSSKLASCLSMSLASQRPWPKLLIKAY
jgi:glycine/D-amino acid oxidase-like deaminating enzyme